MKELLRPVYNSILWKTANMAMCFGQTHYTEKYVLYGSLSGNARDKPQYDRESIFQTSHKHLYVLNKNGDASLLGPKMGSLQHYNTLPFYRV